MNFLGERALLSILGQFMQYRFFWTVPHEIALVEKGKYFRSVNYSTDSNVKCGHTYYTIHERGDLSVRLMMLLCAGPLE